MDQSLYRIVELQLGDSYAKKATDTYEESKLLDQILDKSKPFIEKSSFDKLIYTSFRYDLPVPEIYSARFRPPLFEKNVWYGTYEIETAIFEASFHFLKERVHLKNAGGSVESRTLVHAHGNVKNFLNILKHKNIKKIMDKNSHIASYAVAADAIKRNKDGILYPSCRDPKKGICAAVYNIDVFSDDISKLSELTLNLYYKDKKVNWSRGKSINIDVEWSDIN